MHIYNIKIRTVISVVVPMIIIMTALTTLSYQNIKTVLIDQAYLKLTTSRDMKKIQIEDFFSNVATDIEIIAESKCVRNLVNILDNPESYLGIDIAKEYKNFLLNYTKKNNYKDMLLISAQSGIIKYSQSDESIIGESLNSKKTEDSQLKEAWEKVKESKNTRFVDMKPHKLFGARATMFVATPIFIDGIFNSVLIFQISDKSLSKVMRFNIGYGKTQKDYLIGSDKNELINGVVCSASHSVRASILNITIGNCETPVNQKALCGENGTEIITECNGEKVLSAFSPLVLGKDLNWAIISEINEHIVLSVPNSIKQSVIRDFLIFISIIVAVLVFFIYKDSRHSEIVSQKNREMNETLQTRVAEEVIKNREHQELLFQQSKMASMGEMIGNIAHQWRQPLNALSALNVGLGIRYRAGKLSDYDMLKFKDKSNVLIQKMSDTIDDFRNFFYPDKSIETFRVDTAVEEAINFIKSGYRINNIEIINNINTDIEIKNHKNELIQVMLNIFNNSKDAIKEFNSKDGIVTIGVIDLKDSIIITIQDNGGGIDQNILDRVFEPYFTTKFKDDGTGIGLYMSKMIVEESMYGKLTLINKNNGVLATIVLDK